MIIYLRDLKPEYQREVISEIKDRAEVSAHCRALVKALDNGDDVQICADDTNFDSFTVA